MGNKRPRRGTGTLRKRQYKLRDITEAGAELSVWDLPDPQKTYDPNVVGVFVDRRELSITFGQTLPGVSRILNAISIAVPRSEMENIVEGFRDIQGRLGKLKFDDDEIESCHISTGQLGELAGPTFVRFSAQVIRASSGDEIAVIDFYQKPLASPALAAAQPNKKLEVPPVIRVTCSTLVLSALLSMIASKLQAETQ